MRLVLAFLLASSLLAQDSGVRGRHPERVKSPKGAAGTSNPAGAKKLTPAHFVLWETIEHLRQRMGRPREYYVPAIDKVITPGLFGYYQDTYKKVYDVFYRDTPVGIVRILVAYMKDDSRSHLEPEVRVGHIFFIFDKDVQLRAALNAIYEAQQVCAEGCAMNGFAATVVAQPKSPSKEQELLARRMRPQWHGDAMPDASPGLQIFYQDSPYEVDFEHSYVERIDLTLVSNASQERYSIEVRNKEPTMLDVWRPSRHPSEAAVAR